MSKTWSQLSTWLEREVFRCSDNKSNKEGDFVILTYSMINLEKPSCTDVYASEDTCEGSCKVSYPKEVCQWVKLE